MATDTSASADQWVTFVSSTEIEELALTLKITEVEINKRKLKPLHLTEAKAAERLFRVMKDAQFNAPDSYQSVIDSAKQEHREAVKELIIATRKAKILKAERDAARHAALAEQLELEKQEKKEKEEKEEKAAAAREKIKRKSLNVVETTAAEIPMETVEPQQQTKEERAAARQAEIAARHAAIVAQLEREKQREKEKEQENTPVKAERPEPVAPGAPRKKQKRKAEAEEAAAAPITATPPAEEQNEENEGTEDDLPHKETYKERVKRLFLKAHTRFECKEVAGLQYIDEGAVQLTILPAGKTYTYDVYLLHPVTREELAEMDEQIKKGIGCNCRLRKSYWSKTLKRLTKAHMSFDPSTVPEGKVVVPPPDDLDWYTPIQRVLHWPQ